MEAGFKGRNQVCIYTFWFLFLEFSQTWNWYNFVSNLQHTHTHTHLNEVKENIDFWLQRNWWTNSSLNKNKVLQSKSTLDASIMTSGKQITLESCSQVLPSSFSKKTYQQTLQFKLTAQSQKHFSFFSLSTWQQIDAPNAVLCHNARQQFVLLAQFCPQNTAYAFL